MSQAPPLIDLAQIYTVIDDAHARVRGHGSLSLCLVSPDICPPDVDVLLERDCEIKKEIERERMEGMRYSICRPPLMLRTRYRERRRVKADVRPRSLMGYLTAGNAARLLLYLQTRQKTFENAHTCIRFHHTTTRSRYSGASRGIQPPSCASTCFARRIYPIAHRHHHILIHASTHP